MMIIMTKDNTDKNQDDSIEIYVHIHIHIFNHPYSLESGIILHFD